MSDGFIEYDEDFESTSEETSFLSSEGSSEESSEVSSEVVTDSIPESTISQIKDIHTVSIMALAMFGTMFFLWVFDFLYKKLSHLF